ncbi:MAG: winged helix-turn-helix domain-containing protein [Halobacteriota archaeon]
MELKWRFWFEKDGKPVMGKGGAEILRAIEQHGSISQAAKSLGMSYRFVWNYIEKMENRVGKVVERERGGRSGGKTTLTPLGRSLLEDYFAMEKQIEAIASKFDNKE